MVTMVSKRDIPFFFPFFFPSFPKSILPPSLQDDYNYMNYITEEDFSSPLVVARYSYQARSGDELSFEKGETLVITCYNPEFKKEKGEKWYVVSNNGNGKLLLHTSKEERDGWMLGVSTKPGRENDGEKLVYHRYVGSVGTLAAHRSVRWRSMY